jgi:hypothetical protein
MKVKLVVCNFHEAGKKKQNQEKLENLLLEK